MQDFQLSKLMIYSNRGLKVVITSYSIHYTKLYEHDYKKTMAWLELLNSPKDSMEYKMGRDLFLYSTIFGTERTARDYGRYTPTDYLIDSGLYKALQESADFTNGDNANIIKLQENFIMQYFQHNPAKLLEKQIAETLDKARPEFTKEFDEKNRTINVYALTERNNFV